MEELLVIVLCLFVNGFLAATEIAFVSVPKSRMREREREGDSDASRVLRLRRNPERTLSVIQIGITLVGAVAAAVGGASAGEYVGPWIASWLNVAPRTAEAIAIGVVVLPYTYLSVVCAELVPKAFGLRFPEWITLRSARWLLMFDKACSPIVTLFEVSTKLIMRMFSAWQSRSTSRIDPEPPAGETVELAELSHQTRQYVLNLVAIERKRVRHVCLPWNLVVSVDGSQPLKEVELAVISTGHTRIPVTDGDRVLGVLNAKEFMALRASGSEKWLSIVREPVRVSEGDSLLKALKLMQERHSHLSIVERSGERIGIVTMEDIIEEVIGDVWDEDDEGTIHRLLGSSARFRSLRTVFK